MRLDGVALEMPARILTNEETIDLLAHYSKSSYKGDLKRALHTLLFLLEGSGAKAKRWIDGEKPIDLIENAARRALAEAQCTAKDIDLLIYTGIGRGFLEPGQSYLVADALGMSTVECFDVVDACMSWTRALNIAEAFFNRNQYKKILVINGELINEHEADFFNAYQLTHYEQLKWIFRLLLSAMPRQLQSYQEGRTVNGSGTLLLSRI